MSVKSFSFVYIGIFCFLAVGVLASTTSLWFLRGIVDASESTFEFGLQSPSSINGVLGDDPLVRVNEYLGITTTKYSRMMYTQNASWEYFVGIPFFGRQWSALGELKQASWQVHRIGWILVARRPLETHTEGLLDTDRGLSVSILNGFKSELSAIFLQGLPANPAFIVKTTPGFKSLATGITAYGELKKRVLHISGSYSSNRFISSNMHSIPKKSEQINTLYVSIQSGILHLVSKDLLLAINSVIAHAYHFEKTVPALLSVSEGKKTIGVLLQGDALAIGVAGDGNNFDTTVLNALSKEQGQRHPQRKGFLLPDGTLGHEYVPSNPKVVFTSAQDSDCKNSQGYDDQIVLCSDGNKIFAISQQKDVAKMVVQNLKGDNQEIFGSITGDNVKKLFPKSTIQKLLFSGDEKGADIWLFL